MFTTLCAGGVPGALLLENAFRHTLHLPYAYYIPRPINFTAHTTSLAHAYHTAAGRRKKFEGGRRPSAYRAGLKGNAAENRGGRQWKRRGGVFTA